MKILAIDYGEMRMGFSIGDTLVRTAVPLPPLKRKGKEYDLAHINKIIHDYEIEKIILGYPLNMNGSKGPIIRKVEAFKSALAGNTGIDIQFVDERLTSFEAEELLRTLIKNTRKRKAVIDSTAALVMLRNFLDRP